MRFLQHNTHASLSSAARIWKCSLSVVSLIPSTVAPLFCCRSIKPSLSRIWNASLTGVMETPSSWAVLSRVNTSPSVICLEIIAFLSAAATLSLAGNIFIGFKPSIFYSPYQSFPCVYIVYIIIYNVNPFSLISLPLIFAHILAFFLFLCYNFLKNLRRFYYEPYFLCLQSF